MKDIVNSRLISKKMIISFLICMLLIAMVFIPSFSGIKINNSLELKKVIKPTYLNPLYIDEPWWNSDWQYRRNINITNNNDTEILQEGYTINFIIDTTGDKFLDNGDDLRVVWRDSEEYNELDRINKSSFNSEDTEILFKLQSDISASGFDNSYFVYYGNPSAENPPTNGSNVYFFEDLFNRPASNTVGFGWLEQEVGGSNARIASNSLVNTNVLDLRGTDRSMDCIALHTINGLSEKFIWEYGFVWDRDNIENHYEVYMQIGNSNMVQTSPWTGVGLFVSWAKGTSTTIGIDTSAHEMMRVYDDDQTPTEIEVVSGGADIKLDIDLNSGSFDFYRDNVLKGNYNFYQNLASYNTIRYVSDYITPGNIVKRGIDYTRIYFTIDPSPSVNLGIEEEKNLPPTANDDISTTNEDTIVWIDILTNDNDIDGTLDPTTITIISGPVNGITNINTTSGEIKYTPNTNYFGTDSFTYKVDDDDGATSNIANVNITINSINDPPVSFFIYSIDDLTVSFDGSESYDIDGTIVDYTYDFGDGVKQSSMIIDHTYTSYGTYNVILTVTDNDDDTGDNSNYITLYDYISPELVDNTPTFGFTTDPFTFEATITDAGNVENAYVEYWYGSGSHTNVSMENYEDDEWRKTIILDESIEILHYIISAHDESGNWVSTDVKDVILYDNDPPIIINNSPTEAAAGFPFTFNVTVTDNDELSGVYVEYWYDEGIHYNESMTDIHNGIWEYTIIINLTSNALHYIISAVDLSDNWADTNTIHVLIGQNNAPDKPKINGPPSGIAGIEYEYTFVSIDPDGDDIAEYNIDWGDGQVETITGPFESGVSQAKSHTWISQGTYTIKAKAMDIFGYESNWGELVVKMPRSKAFSALSNLFYNFLQSHPNIFPLLQLFLKLFIIR
ncbi:hypothetical protein AYK24_02575 [Thermoplasmatales archaeon SG8-52-4]|nr:MAG: hypothetical protein AYK24_02575 [Thermoplasmatales archaeon SG8-52-4]